VTVLDLADPTGFWKPVGSFWSFLKKQHETTPFWQGYGADMVKCMATCGGIREGMPGIGIIAQMFQFWKDKKSIFQGFHKVEIPAFPHPQTPSCESRGVFP
jgi:hypothetical protein